jgi:hypothetical protein
MIYASERVFAASGGNLRIEITNSAGESETIDLKVRKLDYAGTSEISSPTMGA